MKILTSESHYAIVFSDTKFLIEMIEIS